VDSCGNVENLPISASDAVYRLVDAPLLWITPGMNGLFIHIGVRRVWVIGFSTFPQYQQQQTHLFSKSLFALY
jgi:hypothetical protein